MTAPWVLVVDDDPGTRTNLADILADLGYRVDTAPDGPSALELVRTNPYDVALLDYKMPGLTGLEVFAQARALHPDLAVVLVTGHGTPEIVDEANRLGFASILLKPFTSDELRSTVEKVLSGLALEKP